MRPRAAIAGCVAIVMAAVDPAVPAHAADARQGAACEWTQWGQSPAHDGEVCVDGQRGLRLLTRITVDPFAAQEAADNFGGLSVHYGVPLIDREGNVFVMQKGGSYVGCDPTSAGTSRPPSTSATTPTR